MGEALTLGEISNSLSPEIRLGEDGRLYLELLPGDDYVASLVAAAKKIDKEVFYRDSTSGRVFGMTPAKASEISSLPMSGIGKTPRMQYATSFQAEIVAAMVGRREDLLKFFSTIE